MSTQYNLKNIRALLMEGFTDRELRRLCYDELDFRPVYEQLAQGMGKNQIIDKLIEYAERKELIETLLALANERNPAKYEKHQPYYKVITSPTRSSSAHGKSQRAIISKQAHSTAGRIRAFMAPSLPPQDIFGRKEDLARLFDLLALDDDQATNVSAVALRGMGGVGKTTLAVNLAHQDDIISRIFPDGVLWAALGPDPTIRLLLDSWGRALGVDLLPEPNEDTCRDRLRAILYHCRTLLIVDDVWEEKHGRYFQIAGPYCRTLFTTREMQVAHHLVTRARTLKLNVLRPDAALALLHSLAPEAVAVDEKSAQRLCEQMEFLPLGLTLAGRLLANEVDVPSRMQRLVNELIEQRKTRLQLPQSEGRLGLNEEQPVSLQAILGMSVDRLSQADQKRFATLAPFGGEPRTWEINAAAHVWNCPLKEAEATVANFIKRGLVEHQNGRYWMHALLADYAEEIREAMEL